MKQILPLLFLLFLCFNTPVFAAIDLQISNFEKSNEYYSVDVELLGAATGSSYYVQSMFTPKDQNTYFGFTWSQKGDWFNYSSSPEPTFIKEYFPKIASGQKIKILIKPDLENPKYVGPGEYILKLKRYTGESTSGTYSNSLSVNLTDSPVVQEPTPTITESPTSPPTPSSTPGTTSTPTTFYTQTITPTKTPTKTPTQTPQISQSNSPTPSLRVSLPRTKANTDTETSTVAGAFIDNDNVHSVVSAEQTPTPSIIGVKKSNPSAYKYPFIIGFISSGVAGLVLYYRKRKFQDKIT